MARKPAAPASRQSIGIRTRTDLKQRLEQIAAENGRSLAQECEVRLERSLDDSPNNSGDPLPGIFSDEVRRALRASRGLAQIVETVADVLFNTMQAARVRDRSEEDTRIALRAALNLVADRYLWRAGQKDTPIEGPLAPLGAHRLDYPAAHMGFEMADLRILALSLWREDDAAADAAEGRLRDLYSGSGRTILSGLSEEQVQDLRQQELEVARAALKRGDVEFEAPDRLHLYKAVRPVPPTQEGLLSSENLPDDKSDEQ